MTRFIRCSLIVAVLAIGGAGSLAPTGPLFAQTPGTAGPVSLGDLFKDGDSVDLRDGAEEKLRDAAQNARDQGNCPKGTFTVVVKKGDDMFQEALAAARRLAMTPILGDQARHFVFEIDFKGVKNDVRVDYGVPRDTIPPALNVTWTPPKGTKVRVGTQITAKAVARDDANRWQSGINTIDLDVQSGGQFGFGDYPQPPQTCESPPPAQTLDGVYTVPANAPPIVRLRAVTKDFAGHEARDIAEFPTGDWYGTLEFSSDSVVLGVRTTFKDRMDIVLTYDGRGNLEGTLVGNRSFKQNEPNCPWEITIPNKLRGKLVGSYTPGAEMMSIQLIEPVVAPAPRKNCPGGGYIYSGGSIHEAPQFKSALRSPRAAGDGRFQSDVTWMTGPIPNSISLRLQRAQN